MTVSILVCDDLPEERANLIRRLRVYEQAHDVQLELETACDGTELLAKWKPERWDVVFLDIYMPQLNGVEAARRMRAVDDRTELVFVTTSREHGMEGFELHALDYLTKPYTQQDVDGAMDWFLRKRAEKHRTLTVRTLEGEEQIPLQEICFLESRGHTCEIHAQGRTLPVRRSIDELSAGLDGAFFRCHKSFLVHFVHVAGLEKNRFLMDDGTSIPISAANLSESKSALLAWRTSVGG